MTRNVLPNTSNAYYACTLRVNQNVYFTLFSCCIVLADSHVLRTPLQHYCTILLLHYCTVLPLYCTTALFFYGTTALPLYCITALFFYCTTTLRHCSTVCDFWHYQSHYCRMARPQSMFRITNHLASYLYLPHGTC